MKTVGLLLSVLGLTTGWAYVVGRTPGYHAEIKWRPMPNPLNFRMWNGRPSGTPTSCQAAMQAWNNEKRSDFTYNLSTETSTNVSQRDYTNVISYNNVGETYLARTTTWFDAPSGDILETDIDVNTYWNWCWTGVPNSSQFDYISVMIHEFGHCQNVKDLYAAPDARKTMYAYMNPGDTNSRTLEQDDKDGIAYLYPRNANDAVWIRDGNSYVDDGSTPYTGNTFWLSPDIQLYPDPPVTGQPCWVYVTARNMRPNDQSARVILEVHDPDVTLQARKNVLWADTLFNQLIPPGNRDVDENGQAEYANPAGQGETTLVFSWTPAPNRFHAGHYCLVATVEGSSDVLSNPNAPYDNNLAQRNFLLSNNGLAGVAETLYLRGGNPAGVTAQRITTLNWVGSDSGWTKQLIPDAPQILNPQDTFVALRAVLTPPSGAPAGKYNTVRLNSVLLSYPAGETLNKGGINWQVVVSEPGDVGVTNISEPTGTINQGTTVTPACIVRNYGTNVQTYTVRLRIGDVYDRSVTVISHSPGTDKYVTFPSWTASPAGSYAVTCSTQLARDLQPGNDRATAALTVRPTSTAGWQQKPDVPSGNAGRKVKDGGALTSDNASLIFALKGNNTCEFYRYSVSGGTWVTMTELPLYGASGRKKAVKKGSCLVWSNGRVYAAKGNGTLEFYEFSSSWVQKTDIPIGSKALKEGAAAVAVTISDTAFICLLKSSGTTEFYRYNTANGTWQTLASAPLGISGKGYKDGSCLAYDGSGTIYLLKGGYNELYAYSIAGNTWTTKTSMPLFGTSGTKKKLKAGGSAAFLNNAVYALKGNNTQEFWCYSPATNQWTQKEDIPLGYGKKVKGGGALTAVADKLFAFTGNNTLAFWQYTPGMLTDQTVAPDQTADRTSRSPVLFAGNGSHLALPAGTSCLRLYDATGRLVREIATGLSAGGQFELDITDRALPTGVYLLKVETAQGAATRKLIVR